MTNASHNGSFSWRTGLVLLLITGLVAAVSHPAHAQRPLRAPAGFRPAPHTSAEPYSRTNWAREIIHEKTGMVLVFIPAGEFLMGNADRLPEEGGPQHRLRIEGPFYLGKCPVTQGQWQQIMGRNPSNFKGSENLPVESVSWDDCQEFLRKIGDNLRLPKEAEWEYACRAGSTTLYSFGNDERDLSQYGWHNTNSAGKTHPVGMKKPNGFGLHDMHGNVGEWCQSLHRDYPYRDDDGRESLEDRGKRIWRGGGWYYYSQYCQSGFRCWNGSAPNHRIYTVGLRLLVPASLDGSEPPSTVTLVGAPASTTAQQEARMIHLHYRAPEGSAFHNEVSVHQSYPGSYFMACGFDGGYFGLQELDANKKVVLFSVWDSAIGDDPHAVPTERRVQVVSQGQGVRIGRFGGEGTGAQCFMDYPWKNDNPYRFLVTARRNANRTEFSGYFYLPEARRWVHLATFSKVTDRTLLRGCYSFVEDFKRNTTSATKERAASFGNGWVLSGERKWTALTQAQFTAKSTPGTNINAEVVEGRFLLATGGATRNTGGKINDTMTLPDGVVRAAPVGLPLDAR